MAQKELKPCMVKDCTGYKAIRGLCLNHYATAFKKVRSGKFTWEELEEKGLLLKARVRSTEKGGFLWEVKKDL